MRIGGSLFSAVRFFTRPNCALCAEAKHQVELAAKSVKFSYSEVDITVPENAEWFKKYAFDVPVLHVQSSPTSEPYKIFMHRVRSHELIEAIKE